MYLICFVMHCTHIQQNFNLKRSTSGLYVKLRKFICLLPFKNFSLCSVKYNIKNSIPQLPQLTELWYVEFYEILNLSGAKNGQKIFFSTKKHQKIREKHFLNNIYRTQEPFYILNLTFLYVYNPLQHKCFF